MWKTSRQRTNMQKRLIELHQQRGRLQERIAHQRVAMRQQLVPLQGVLAVPDRVARIKDDGIAFVRAHPLAVGAVVLAVVLLRPRMVLRWGSLAAGAWRTWRTVSGLVPGFVWNQLQSYR